MLTYCRSVLFIILILFSSLPSWASLKAENKKSLIVKKIYLTKSQILSGDSSELVIELKLEKGFVAYVDKFSLNTLNPSTPLTPLIINPTFYWQDKYSNKVKKGVKGNFKIKSLYKIPPSTNPGKHKVSIVIEHQYCKKNICFFPSKMTASFDYEVISYESAQMPQKEESFFLNKKLKNTIGDSFFLALLFCFLAGILTSFTPCILPMVPITLIILGVRKDNTSHLKKFLLSFIYVLGICSTYSFLGVLAVKTGTLFGSALQSPYIITAIAFIFVAMGLSMYGLFEIKMPTLLTNKLTKYKTQQNYWGAYVTGLIAGLLASPCVGPVLIVILTYVTQQQDTFYGAALLFAYAFGMGQLFLLLGTFSQFIAQFLKVGLWSKIIRWVFGTIMIFMAFYFIEPFLPETGLIKQETKASLQFQKWQTYDEKKIEELRKSGKPIVLDFYADWCLACKDIEHNVINSPEIKIYHNEISWIQFDATKESPEFLKLKKQYKIIGLPHIVFYDKDGKYLEALTLQSYESVSSFKKRIKQILDIN